MQAVLICVIMIWSFACNIHFPIFASMQKEESSCVMRDKACFTPPGRKLLIPVGSNVFSTPFVRRRFACVTQPLTPAHATAVRLSPVEIRPALRIHYF